MIAETKSSEGEMDLRGVSPVQILLAYDGSRHAQAAVEMLNNLSLCPGSKITVMAVMPTQHITGHEVLLERLDQVKERLDTSGVEVVSELRAGNPAATINEFALWNEVNLTVIGAKGLRATLGILLGGVAQQVVEYSCCPVLVVREPFRELQRILLVTDGSDFSQQAIEYIRAPAGSRCPLFPLPAHADVIVAHVLPPPISPDMMARSWTVGPEVLLPVPPAELDIDALEKREAEEGQALLQRAVADLAAGGVRADSVLLRGDAATEIIQYVEEQDVDLIIAGSRGLSQVSGWLLGSVSRKLVHYAGCSVLVVKGQPMEV